MPGARQYSQAELRDWMSGDEARRRRVPKRGQKLTDQQVIQIRRTRRATGAPWQAIADAIGGVTMELVRSAGVGKYYQHLDEIEPPLPKGQRARKRVAHNAKLTPEQVREIRDAHGREGVTQSLARAAVRHLGPDGQRHRQPRNLAADRLERGAVD